MRRILPFVSVTFFLVSLYMVHSSGWTFGTKDSILALVFFLWALLTALFGHVFVLYEKIEKLEGSLQQNKKELFVSTDHY